MEFKQFNKIPRLSRECTITEKIDGTNAQVYIGKMGEDNHQYILHMYNEYDLEGNRLVLMAGSRTRWLTLKEDNMGFANWVYANKDELFKLGEGRHFGEWWGKKIQRGYNLNEKRFSLFNTSIWTSEFNEREDRDINKSTVCKEIPICHVVPLIARIQFNTSHIETLLGILDFGGSYASPGFMKPEGIVIYHIAGGYYFKKTIEKDNLPKSVSGE